MLTKIIVWFTYVATLSEAARILAVFPIPSISHQVVFRPLTQELARRGHEVVVITTDPAFSKDQAPANLTEIDLHDIAYKMWNEYFVASISKGSTDELTNQTNAFLKSTILLIEQQLENYEIQKIIKEDTFDLLLLEACVKSALIYSYLFKAPVIQVSSLGAIFGNFEAVGAPTHPFLYPTVYRQRMINLTMWEKATELYNHYSYKELYNIADRNTDEMFRKRFGPEVPSLEQLAENVDMLFLNEHQIFHGVRPVPPSVVYMGGLHQKDEEELPNDLKSYLDSSENGVIYISFGTNVDTNKLPDEKIQIFVQVFSQLPYDVLWKWNSDELPGRSKNIRISKWLPQSDLLRHPKIKVFITQGGLQSTDEAITAGVPLIGVPMLGDQWYNVHKYIHHGIGVRIDMETVTENQLKDAIENVINDERYRQNVVKLRSLINDQPQRPLERAVWWTEHLLRHGGARHLRAPAANITWTEYLELELVLTVLSVFVASVIAATIFLYYLYFKSSEILSYRFGKLKQN